MENEWKEFQQKTYQKLCDYQEAVRGGAKISLNEIIDDLRSDIQQYEDTHSTNQ